MKDPIMLPNSKTILDRKTIGIFNIKKFIYRNTLATG